MIGSFQKHSHCLIDFGTARRYQHWQIGELTALIYFAHLRNEIPLFALEDFRAQIVEIATTNEEEDVGVDMSKVDLH